MNILKLIPDGSVGAEIGVWKGGNARHLLTTGLSRLYLVDPWVFDPDAPGFLWSGKDPEVSSQEDMDRIYAQVVNELGSDPRTRIIRARSIDAADQVDEQLDWVYIDGDHRYDQALTDMRVWSQSIVPGGLMVVDDYSSRHQSVIDAVSRFIYDNPELRGMRRDKRYLIRFGE